ncbi:MAG: hypothetical protein ABIR67_02430 [Gaiellaceae bacterium]
MPEPTQATWLLTCGHKIPMLEHDRRGKPPARPRICPVCEKPRNVST